MTKHPRRPGKNRYGYWDLAAGMWSTLTDATTELWTGAIPLPGVGIALAAAILTVLTLTCVFGSLFAAAFIALYAVFRLDPSTKSANLAFSPLAYAAILDAMWGIAWLYSQALLHRADSVVLRDMRPLWRFIQLAPVTAFGLVVWWNLTAWL